MSSPRGDTVSSQIEATNSLTTTSTAQDPKKDMDKESKSTEEPLKTSSTTLYPKILKLKDFLYNLKKLPEYQSPTSSIHLTGSIKLHGTHADIVFPSPTSDEFRLQSRNKAKLVPGKEDNAGFAGWVAGIEECRILDLRDRFLKRYQELNPGRTISGDVIVAGEFCGPGVQRGVAVSKVPKCLAIVSVYINGEWVPDWKFADICDGGARTYHIGKAGFLEHELRLEDVAASEAKIKELVMRWRESQGEGIVWKATKDCGDPSFWFKSKGDLLSVSHSDKLPASAVEKENRDRVENFARAVVTEVRLEQSWEYLEQKNATGLGSFLKWVLEDCLVEENREMEELKISRGKFSPAVTAIAKPWFWGKLKELDGA